MLNIQTSFLSLKRYQVFAGIATIFILFLGQKENFIPTMTGIMLTLLSLFLILKIKATNQNYKLALYALTTKAKAPLIQEGIFVHFDKYFNITHTSEAFTELFGHDKGNVLHMFTVLSIEERLLKKMQEAINHKDTFNEMITLTIRHKPKNLDTFIHPINNPTFTKSSYIMRFNDITQYIQAEQTLKDEVLTDRFTKLPTRIKLLEEIEKSKSINRSHPQTLIYIRINDYEETNEFFGIETGHALIQHMSEWLQQNLPRKKAQVYKFDHNNFAIYTSARLSLAELESYLKTLSYKASNVHFTINDIHHDISISIGVSRGNRNLLKHAYLALKEALKANKDYKIFNKNNHQEERYLHNIQINKEIKNALLEDRVVPFFQPILNIHTNQVEKFESLIRIQNKNNTHMRPVDFLDIAKQSKLYFQLTKAMIVASLKRLEYLQQPITINLSVEDITNYKISSFIIRQLQKSPFHALVTFEILETTEILNYTKVSNFIKKVKLLGCQVAIDDFGSGYSNFEQVLKLDIDYIKIDGSLIKNILTSKESEIVIKTIISFAKDLGVKTVAEYVSNEAIFNKVKSLGIDYAQGYYIGKPSPITIAPSPPS